MTPEQQREKLLAAIEGALWSWLPDIEKATRGMYGVEDVAGGVLETIEELITPSAGGMPREPR